MWRREISKKRYMQCRATKTTPLLDHSLQAAMAEGYSQISSAETQSLQLNNSSSSSSSSSSNNSSSSNSSSSSSSSSSETVKGKAPSTEQYLGISKEVVPPEVPEGYVEKIAEEMYGLKVTACKQLNGYNDKNYHILVSPTSSNPHVTSVRQEGYVMRVVNSLHSREPAMLSALLQLMQHVGRRGIPTQDPVPAVNGDHFILYDFNADKEEGDEARTHAVCLKTFLPGTTLHDVTLTYDLCFKVGALVASMTKALEDFHHPFYDTFDLIWSMSHVPTLRRYVHVITDVRDRRVVDDVIQQFCDQVLPRRSELRRGYIHGDPSHHNILLQRRTSAAEGSDAGDYVISGVLDFHDATDTHPLYDLAMSIAYLMLMPSIPFDPLEVAGHILAGYTSKTALPAAERALVRVCVAGRLTQSLVLGVYNHSLDPGNAYLLTTGQTGWRVLHALWDRPQAEVERLWDTIQRSYAAD